MKGVYTALVTPFTEKKTIDWDGLKRLFEFQAKQKVTGLVIGGTTAETATLSSEEKKELYQFARKETEKFSFDLVAGTGTNNTAESIEWTKTCGSLGYKKFLVVTPYYNKPNQRGLIGHFEAIADVANGEIILYNVPGRTNISFTPETVARLAQKKNITAIKEATGNLTFASEIIQHVKSPGFSLISGDDPTYFPFLCLGGKGSISVASHLVGETLEKMTTAVAEGKLSEARTLHERIFPLTQALFLETNPTPVKWILSELGFIRPDVRLPLVEISKETELKLRPFVDELKAAL
jgi:4-hydroxy-tetrahydrodipicolinate synthase